MTANAMRASLDAAAPVQLLWPAPDKEVVSTRRGITPTMPGDLFGACWPLIQELAEGAGAPVDYVGMSLLTVAASLIGGKRRVRPFSTSNWAEPCILWTALVGDPSSNKSPAIDAATGPLRQMEVEHAERHKSVRRSFETTLERAKAERNAWQEAVKSAQKVGEPTPERPEIADTPDEPQRRKLMLMDATPEAVGAILCGNPEGTLLNRDELTGWLTSFDRYAPGGRTFWLEAYGGRPYTIDRKGAPELIVPFNGVSVLGGIQPDRVAETLEQADDGLIPRFLWAWPKPVPFRRPSHLADGAKFERLLRRLDSLSFGVGESGDKRAVTLDLTSGTPDKPGAAEIFAQWCADNDEGIADAASLYKGFCGKLRGTVLRLALTGELLAWAAGEGPEPRVVSSASLLAAIEFVETYSKPMAALVFGDAGLPRVDRNAARLARYILKRQLRRFNVREDLKRGTDYPADLKQPHATEEAIEVLIEADWLRDASVRAGDTPGRARKDYLVNPAVFA